ncbi:zinc ABC transporter permease [Tessaracoccus sp. G1721]
MFPSLSAADSAKHSAAALGGEGAGAEASTGGVGPWRTWLSGPALMVGLSMPFWRHTLVTGFPIEIAVFALAVAAGTFVRPTVRTPALPWVALAYFSMLGSVIAVSVLMEQPWLQRSVRLSLLFFFAAVVAQGRINWKSVVAGGTLSLVLVNAPAFYLGLTPNNYPPFLTGWLGDKNVSGLYYAVMSLFGLSLYQERWPRAVHFSAMFGLLWLTGSRTGLAGAVIGLAWYLVRNRFGLVARVALLGVSIWVLQWFEERYSRIGAFADREGTDLLRASIHAAEQVKLAGTAWYGRGFNTAVVDLASFHRMFFHDSYAALQVEGGLPMLVVVLGLFVGVGLGLGSRRRIVSPELRSVEAAIVTLMVCAWQLGEVFLTSLGFFLLGVAMFERFGERTQTGSLR